MLFLIGQCFAFSQYQYKDDEDDVNVLKKIDIYNECSLSNKRSDWSVVNNEGNSISIQPMSFG